MATTVGEKMTRDVRLTHPDETIRVAARTMAEIGVGALPVAEGDRLVGVVTDRDIAVRAVAEGKGPDTLVQEVMTPEVKYCFDFEDLELQRATWATAGTPPASRGSGQAVGGDPVTR